MLGRLQKTLGSGTLNWTTYGFGSIRVSILAIASGLGLVSWGFIGFSDLKYRITWLNSKIDDTNQRFDDIKWSAMLFFQKLGWKLPDRETKIKNLKIKWQSYIKVI